MRIDCRFFLTVTFLFSVLFPVDPSRAGVLRRPVDICPVRSYPSHGGELCQYGLTGNGCRFDCGPNTAQREDSRGISYQCPYSTEILAAAGGWVLDVWSVCSDGDFLCGGGLGNFVIMEHPGGIRTIYAGLSAASVVPGQSLECGEVLGWTGRTGNFQWEGLWFELQDFSYRSIDPFSGPCNPEFFSGLWVEQSGADSGRSCAGSLHPNEGWIGYACLDQPDCLYEGGICLDSFPGGMCSAECEYDCPRKSGSGYAGTVCMAAPGGSFCVASCSGTLFPGTGCRDGYACIWVSTVAGTHEPGCLPETQELPDGGVPDVEPDIPDAVETDVPLDSGEPDSGNDGGTGMTVGGSSPGCQCRSIIIETKENNKTLFFLVLLFLFRWTKRVFSVVLQDLT